MKYREMFVILTFIMFFCASWNEVDAKELMKNNYESDGHIKFAGKIPDYIIDPEHPENKVNPGESAHTSGPLRIDFVPKFQFGQGHEMKDKDIYYPVQAQLFHDQTKARGNFVQITDEREGAKGWTLQLKQEYQFRNEKDSKMQLTGAVLSLDKSWSNTDMPDFDGPEISKEVINIENIGQSYNLARAKQGTGYGRWVISFGMSDENPVGEKGTLSPKTDKNGALIVDPNYENQPIYENSAVKLLVPGKVKKVPGSYNTVLTWILAELP